MGISKGWPAPAKINLFLQINGRRGDGYHNLQTIFQFINVCDQIDFQIRDDGIIERDSDLAGVSSEDDLTVKAAKLLREHVQGSKGATITVHKRIPMGAGLGGGSSNAATVLVALNFLWGLNLPESDLVALGLRLGADVPIFVRGKSAWAEGIGEKLSPFSPEVGPIFVIIPNCEVPTQEIFNDPLLTRDTDAIKMHEFSIASSRNDCELVTRRLYPSVGDALDWLGHYRPARMSGTGSSVFAFFECREELQVVKRSLPSDWIGFAAERENYSPLLKKIDKESKVLKG